MNPAYHPRHAVAEGQAPGFTYGFVQRWVTFAELFSKGPRRVFSRSHGYRGCSTELAAFFEKLHKDDLTDQAAEKEREAEHRRQRSLFDTITMNPVTSTVGRHRLREQNQWPTEAQILMAEATR
jgi:hypothetical protein